MKQLAVKPEIYKFETAKEFAEAFKLGKDDLVITNEYIYKPFFGALNLPCATLFQEKYGTGEPSDDMVEAMYKDVHGSYKRIIAIGGGTVIDISKFFSLTHTSPVLDLYDGKQEITKSKELIIVPTTCGTGSEVTNIAVLSLNARGTKKGLAHDAMYGDYAVLIPELLKNLPFNFFATSSIDALVHAVESSLSPTATESTKLFGYKAIEMILKGFKEIEKNGRDARIPLLTDFLLASNYAGIAFSIAGCAAVHAMSYPIGATFHVAHGESNYAMFTGVLKNYLEIKKDGEIEKLNRFMADILGCDIADVYDALEKLLNCLIQKKPLHEYGMKKEQIAEFADSVIANQQRLMANNFVVLDRDRLIKIYTELF